MAGYKIDITGPAKADIRELAAYIANELKEPEIADRHVDLILEAIFGLEHMPTRIPKVRDDALATEGVHGMRVRNYTVFFLVDEVEMSVTIVRVRHMRRDWPDIVRI